MINDTKDVFGVLESSIWYELYDFPSTTELTLKVMGNIQNIDNRNCVHISSDVLE